MQSRLLLQLPRPTQPVSFSSSAASSKFYAFGFLAFVCFSLAFRVTAVTNTSAQADAFTTAPGRSLILRTAVLLSNDVAGSANGTNHELTLVGVSSSTQRGAVQLWQDGAAVWTNWYRRASFDDNVPHDITADSVGNVYVTGEFDIRESGPSTYGTLKYRSDGTSVWTNQSYKGKARAIRTDERGDVYVTGWATIKYLADGTAAWTNAVGSALAVAGDGSIYVASYSAVPPVYNYDFMMTKYLPDGTPVWTNFYNGTGNSSDFANEVALDPAGNVYVTGSSIGLEGLEDYATIKYLPNGNAVWTNRFAARENSRNFPAGMGVDSGGNVYVTGKGELLRPQGGADYTYATIKILPDGSTAWAKYFSNDFSIVKALALDVADNLYITGLTEGAGNGFAFTTLKYLPDGTTVWTNNYDGPGNDQPSAITAASDGSVYVTGAFEGTNGQEYATIKYLADGSAIWTNRFGALATGHSSAQALVADNNGGVFVTGYSTRTGNSTEYATIKYATSPQVTYTPPAGFTGLDTFTYIMQDSLGQTATGTVSVVVGNPTLRVQPAPGSLTLQWPASFSGYVPESTAALGPNNPWMTPYNVPVISGSNYSLAFPTTNARQFFRLQLP